MNKESWSGGFFAALLCLAVNGGAYSSLSGADSAPEPVSVNDSFLSADSAADEFFQTDSVAVVKGVNAVVGDEKPLAGEEDDAVGEGKSLAELQKSMDDLKSEIDKMRKDLEKKQNAPDPNKKFTAKLGGLITADAIAVNQSDANQALYGDIDNQFGFHDLRLWARGEGYGNLSYEAALGFNNGVSFKNVNLIAKDIPFFGEMKIGYFKVESGIGYAANVFNNTFSDWDSNCKTFQVGRRLGVGSTHFSEKKNLRFFTGVYTGQNLDFGSDKESAAINNDRVGLILNSRLTGVPIYRESTDGDLLEVVHLGAGFRWVDPGKDSAGKNRKTNLRSLPAAWIGSAPYLLKGGLDADSYTTTNIEAAWQKNRLGVVSEGFIGTYDGYDDAYGVTVTGRFLLTPGVYQTYDKKNGAFGEMHIPKNMRFIDYGDRRCLDGPGVWEIAGQWAWTDLDPLRDVPAAGTYYGRMNQYLFALNWYWNPQTRLGLNWIHAVPDSGLASADSETEETANDTIACQVRVMF